MTILGIFRTRDALYLNHSSTKKPAVITKEEYTALKRAVLLRETRTVEFEGRKVEYSSFSEMERRLTAIERELASQNRRPRQYGISSSKGI